MMSLIYHLVVVAAFAMVVRDVYRYVTFKGYHIVEIVDLGTFHIRRSDSKYWRSDDTWGCLGDRKYFTTRDRALEELLRIIETSNAELLIRQPSRICTLKKRVYRWLQEDC